MLIYYNPECSKCKEAVQLLEENKCEVTLRNYLQDPPSAEELKALLQKLGCKATDIVRKKEFLFIENYEGKTFSEEEWLKILSENPVLIERPIVVNGAEAIIGRPPVLVLDLLK